MARDELTDGSVLRYNFLWSHERAAGREEGRKPGRTNVLAKRLLFEGEEWILILPITSLEPAAGTPSYELSDLEVRRSGLRGPAPLWVILDEVNFEPVTRSYNLEPDAKIGDLGQPTYRAILRAFRDAYAQARKTRRA